MVSIPTKNIIIGNIQLIEYCNAQHIDLNKLQNCNIEKMGNTYFFVLSKRNVGDVSMDDDIDCQPDVVLTMDVTDSVFQFNNTDKTERIFN